MEKIKQLLQWLLPKPIWVKILSLIITLLITIIFLFSATSCGGTRAVARISDSGTSTITITTSNPTTVNASPEIDLKLNGKNIDENGN